MSKIAVVIGSIHDGRVTDRQAKWVAAEVAKRAEVEIIDLADYPLPLFSEAGSPRYVSNRQPSPEAQKWLDKIQQFDGYVFVTPEYNRATSPVLKNAIDYLDYQLEHKPVALVGHGSAGGAQAIGSLRNILPGVGAVTTPKALYFTYRVSDTIDESGLLNQQLRDDPHGPQAHLANIAQEIVRFAEALTTARAQAK